MRLRKLFTSPWDRPPLTPMEVRLRGLLVLIGGPAFLLLVVGGAHLLAWLITGWVGQEEGMPIGVGLCLVAAGFACVAVVGGLTELVTGVEFGEWTDRWGALPAWVRLVVAYGLVFGLGGGALVYMCFWRP